MEYKLKMSHMDGEKVMKCLANKSIAPEIVRLNKYNFI
jgi:hypothetical protein